MREAKITYCLKFKAQVHLDYFLSVWFFRVHPLLSTCLISRCLREYNGEGLIIAKMVNVKVKFTIVTEEVDRNGAPLKTLIVEYIPK